MLEIKESLITWFLILKNNIIKSSQSLIKLLREFSQLILPWDALNIGGRLIKISYKIVIEKPWVVVMKYRRKMLDYYYTKDMTSQIRNVEFTEQIQVDEWERIRLWWWWWWSLWLFFYLNSRNLLSLSFINLLLMVNGS